MSDETNTAGGPTGSAATTTNAATTPASGPEGTAATAGRAMRKTREGVVVSDKMDRTAVVLVTSRVRHPRYDKTVQRTTRMYVDDPANDLHAGDRVRIQETRPMSKLKRWRLVQVLERAR